MNLTRARSVIYAAMAASCAIPAAAQEAFVPTPRVVIYPGDVIRDDMLADVAEPARDGSGPFVEQRSLIVGKVARLTLLPGTRSLLPAFPTASSSPTALRSGSSTPMGAFSS
jgi:flagellar basal body P-ring formation protein FlgA